MVASIIILLLLIGITYRREVMKPAPGKPVWYAYRKIGALLAMTILPVLAVNFFLPSEVVKTPDDKVELGRKDHNTELLREGYRELSARYPDSLEIQFRYIDHLVNVEDYSYTDFQFNFRRCKPLTKALMLVYMEVVSDSPKVKLTRLDSFPQDARFVHYVRALAYRSFDPKNLARVRYHLRCEVMLYPHSQRGWEFLWTLFMHGHERELDALLQNDDAKPFIPRGYRQHYYFEHGQYRNYAETIIESRLYDVTLITLISAFLVSFVWLVFLRSMDVFNREKWRNIAFVFLGGAVFTLLCLPIYDYAGIFLDFRVNGDAWNDFLYCVSIIGGGEELVKMLPWVLFALVSKRFREPYDYLLYASVAALGFAFTENLMYLEDSGSIVSRSIMSTVGHMFDASVVAYAVILAKYKFKKRVWKIATPAIGFLLAAACHSFYDFWLISPAVDDYYYITLLFFLVALHIWFFFKNNAMNNSGFFVENSFKAGFQQDLLTFSMLGLLILEFIVTSMKFGSTTGNEVIGERAIIVVVFLAYISVIIHRIDLKKGVWHKWRFRIPRLSKGFLRLPFSTDEDYDETEQDFVGLKLRLFAPKTNLYIGNKLPKSGVCIRKITVNGNPNWYVFQLNTPIDYNTYVATHIILKSKYSDQPLNKPKIEIYFMFIPEIDMLQYDDLDIKQLRYEGRAYAMPIT